MVANMAAAFIYETINPFEMILNNGKLKQTQSKSSKILLDFKVTKEPPSLDSGTLLNSYFINARIFESLRKFGNLICFLIASS